MATKRSNALNSRAESKTKLAKDVEAQVEEISPHTVIEVQDSGEWIAAVELKERAQRALEDGNDLTFNLGNLSYLDASALQILLAVDVEQRRQERQLHLANACGDLRLWFQHAGAIERFSMIERTSDEQ